ncbi:RNA polymerase sigma factor SigM [Kitasatospora sp. NPDC005748]|uniref:RNA polymerase sigma factor SigM n=1 Tax=Kitasatospora sp. NPDC005748 TaxID=3157063 RepID=UPI0034023E09
MADGADRTDDDAALLARHVAGDRAAFGLLVDRHRDRLWAVALRTLGDREEAADALQDALVSAFRAAHTFQGRSAVTTWLHRIVVNACLDRARRTAARRTKPLDDDPQRLDAMVGSAEPADSPVVRAELHREVAAALGELAPEQRAALVLVDMQGYPVAEAAELLGVPVGTVKSRCARGRARLLPLVRHLREGRGADVSRAAGVSRAADVSRETGPSGAASPDGAGPSGTAPGGRAAPPGNPPGARTVRGTGPDTGRPLLEGDASTR